MLPKIVHIEKDRIRKLSEITTNSAHYFASELQYGAKMLQWKSVLPMNTAENLKLCAESIAAHNENDWSVAALEYAIKQTILLHKKNNGEILWPLRVALSGQKASPSPFEIAWILGKEITLKRIQYAITLLEVEDDQ